jgi:tRNA (guanine26-N2/guanine27-N2)-dimethyltransferase
LKCNRILEGGTVLCVPDSGVAGGGGSQVFFNPVASLNRDVSVAIAAAVGGRTFCDSMSGVGARGIRIANEVEDVQRVTMVDLNRKSLGLARRAADLNGVLGKCSFICGDTNEVLFREFQGKERQGFVDIDPFGTPIRHLNAAISATADRGVLSVTATDTAVLCGVHQRVCRRRYGARSLNNSFHHETAIRILVNSIRRLASSLELGISPVAAHSTRHYVRVYARIEVGVSRADSNLQDEGYVHSCAKCGEMRSAPDPSPTCQVCGGKNRMAGPLWIGNLVDSRVLSAATDWAKKRRMKDAAKLLGSLKSVNSFPPWSFGIEEACSALGLATVPERLVKDDLSRKGFKAMRQPFEVTGLKTTAPYTEFVDSVKQAGRKD